MEDYPPGYVSIARPLIVISGLQEEPASPHLPSPLNNGPATPPGPPVGSARAKDVLGAFMSFDSEKLLVDSAADHLARTPQSLRFRLRPSSRRYVFPCRKASPPPSQMTAQAGSLGTAAHSAALHSPLSPLSMGSPLFPDGCMTPLWMLKYLDALPAAFVSFFDLGYEKNNNTLNDNRLKSEINAIKSSLNDSNYKGKFAVVLIGESSLADETNLDDRLGYIRKACKLDNKTTFFFLPSGASKADLVSFADSVLQALRPACLEFYKTLHKHARRKKDRRSIPSTPTAENAPKNLLSAGWNARYSYKMGLFSEIRMEMDAATRSYDEALDALIGADGIFQQTSNWSPRWNETRLFADAIAIRRTRCLLSDGLPTSAVAFFNAYRERTKVIADTAGKGTSTYAWQCWEARWSKIMGQIVQESPLTATDVNARNSIDTLTTKRRLAFASPEKQALSDERYNPWSRFLHHEGYWYALSAAQQTARAILARAIPEDDKSPPGQSPATAVARVHKQYDVYLCPEPHVEGNQVDHVEEIIEATQLACTAFKERDHKVATYQLQLRIAKELISRSPEQAIALLKEVWVDSVPLRRAGWNLISEDIALALYSAAVASKDPILQITALWELLNNCKPLTPELPTTLTSLDFARNKNVEYNLMELVENANELLQPEESKQVLTLKFNEILSFVNINLCFESPEAYAGEKIRLQLVLRSDAQAGTPPVEFTSLRLTLEGLPSIMIYNETGAAADVAFRQVSEVSLQEGGHDGSTAEGLLLTGSADLNLAPSQYRVFVLHIPVRETGKFTALEATLEIDRPHLSLKVSKDLRSVDEPFYWYTLRSTVGMVKARRRWDAGKIEVLPKLPKLRIRLPHLRPAYYTNEKALIDVEMVNEESETISAHFDAWIAGTSETPIAIVWSGEVTDNKESDHEGGVRKTLGTLSPGESTSIRMTIPFPAIVTGELSLEIEVQYHADDGDQTTVSKTTSTKLNLMDAFHAAFSLTPLYHSEAWPSFFDEQSPGFSLRWRLQAFLESQASEEIVIKSSDLSVSRVGEGAKCSVSRESPLDVSVAPLEHYERTLLLDIQRENLDEAHPSIIDSSLKVKWRRIGAKEDDFTESIIQVPRLSLPTSEPRALATRYAMADDSSIRLVITLENPSMHYLSFETTVEPTDDFVLSGPTRCSTNLVPLSRHSLEYTILPMIHGAFIRPFVKTIDTHFNKLLRIHPGEDLAADEAGNIIIWVPSAKE